MKSEKDYRADLEREFNELFKKGCKEMDFEELFRIAISKVDQLSSISSEEEMLLVELGEALVVAFEKAGKQALFKQAHVAPYVNRATHQKAVLDKYIELKEEIKKNTPPDYREQQLEYMEALERQELESMMRDGYD